MRWGALASPVRRPGIARDLPGVVAISIVAAPLIVPVSLVVGVGLLVDAAADVVLRFVAGLLGRRPDPPGPWVEEAEVGPQTRPASR